MKINFYEERRDFLRKMFSAAVMTAVCPHILLGKVEPEILEKGDKLLGIYTLNINDYPNLRNIYGSYRISIPNTDGYFPNVLVTRLSREEFDKDFACVSESCPHEANPVENLNLETLLFECKKGHGSLFLADGTYVWGKADKKNLEPYKIEWDQLDTLRIDIPAYITSTEEQSYGMSYLSEANPNPVSGITSINYGIERAGFVNISLFDLQGRQIRQLADSYKIPGNYRLSLDVSDLQAGIYLCKMKAGSGSPKTIKVTVLK